MRTESHEKRSGNFAWQTSEGEGATDETLRQSVLIAKGNIAIQAANGVIADVPEIDRQTVSQTIDAMVAADPDLAWLKAMEARGDVDWRRVKEIHDSWSYEQSGLGANQVLKNGTAAVLDQALGGEGDLGDALQASLANTFSAAGFNAIGDATQGSATFTDGSLSKAGLHAVMGGLAAEAMGGDFKTGAVAAGANELLVDRLASQYDAMPPGEKGRLLTMNSQLIGVLAAELSGGDASQGAQIAAQATTYNRLLHTSEGKWLRKNAKRFAEAQGVSEQEALDRLSQQALKDVDYLWRSLLDDGDDSAAQAFLASTGQTFTNDRGQQQALFTASGQQLFRPEMFADTADPRFYRDFVQSGISRDLSIGVLEEVKDSSIELKDDAVDLGQLLVEQPEAVLDGLWEGIRGLPQGIVDGIHESGNVIGEGMAVALNTDLSNKLDAIYGLDVSAAQRGLLLVRTLGAIAGAGTAGAAGNAGTELVGNIAEAASKQLDGVLGSLAKQALLKSGGVHGVDGEPLLDIKQLTTAQKGAMGELFGPHTVKQIVPEGNKLARMPGVGETGIDDLYKVNRPDVDYVVIEYKFVGPNSKTGASGLGKTQDGRQGSESWISGSGRLEKAVGDTEAGKIYDAILFDRYETWVVATRPDGATEVQVLDASGKAKPIDTSKILNTGIAGERP